MKKTYMCMVSGCPDDWLTQTEMNEHLESKHGLARSGLEGRVQQVKGWDSADSRTKTSVFDWTFPDGVVVRERIEVTWKAGRKRSWL